MNLKTKRLIGKDSLRKLNVTEENIKSKVLDISIECHLIENYSLENEYIEILKLEILKLRDLLYEYNCNKVSALFNGYIYIAYEVCHAFGLNDCNNTNYVINYNTSGSTSILSSYENSLFINRYGKY